MDVVKQWKPSVIVLNRGIHFVALPQFLDELEGTMQGLRAIAPDALVVYRNTPMGKDGRVPLKMRGLSFWRQKGEELGQFSATLFVSSIF